MVKIYGYSDDTVCLDNSKYFENEIECFDVAGVRLYLDDGTVLVNFTDGIDKLIMYTCYPFGCYSPTNQRYVVQAVLQA